MLDTDFVAASQQDSRRLMIVLHGLGDSIEGYRWLPQALNLSWLNYLLVNAPDPYYGGFGWFDLSGDPNPGIDRSRKLLFGLLDEQREKGFPTAQTILFGFSQGCLLAYEIGFRYPHRLGGLVGVSGWAHNHDRLVKERSPAAFEQRFLITHGTEDPMVPFAPVRKQVEELSDAGAQIEWHEFRKAHTIAGVDELQVIRRFVERLLR